MDRATRQDRAERLIALHERPEILTLVNVWDVESARAVADSDGCEAIATASAAIAATHGFPDGERIPVDLVLATVERISEAVDLPVTADLEGGYGDVDETIRRAVQAGVVGANIEDELMPQDESVARMEAVVKAAAAEGVPFALNARTDAYLSGTLGAADAYAAAVTRGRAYLDVGATCVFVPGLTDLDMLGRIVDELGRGHVSAMCVPGGPTPAQPQDIGVARASFGPVPAAGAHDPADRYGHRPPLRRRTPH